MDVEDEVHFEVKDFAGRTIICTELQWVDHVCGRRAHRYMEGTEPEVIAALQNPDHGIRYIDNKYPTRRCYYRVSRSGDYYVKVIVKYDDERCAGVGYVVTAFMPDEVTRGEIAEIRI